MPKRDQVAVRRENKQFTLAVGLVGRAVDIGFGQEVELRLELLVEAIHIMHVNVVGEAAVAGRGAVRAFFLQQSKSHRFAMQIRVVRHAQKHLEAQRFGEERQGAFDIGDVHERRDLDKVRQEAASRPESTSQLDAETPVWTQRLFCDADPVNLRSATAADISLLMELERACPTAAHWTERQYRQAVGGGSDSSERLVLVAEVSPPAVSAAERGRDSGYGILGFLVARHLTPEWELENVVVAPAARRGGLGRQLLGALLAAASETDSEAVFLEVRESNTAARKLYERVGFEQTGRRKSYYTSPLEDAILYRRNVGPSGFS